MMQITVHDVGAGACMEVETPNGARFLLDCGFSSTRLWWPSTEYKTKRIDRLILQNIDEDHVRDLPDLLNTGSVLTAFTNPTIGATQLARLKQRDKMGPGVDMAHSLLAQCGAGHIGPLVNLGNYDVAVQCFWNNYGAHFSENDASATNNLSVVTFFRWGHFVILFGGDMEREGWDCLMRNPYFRSFLPHVKVYVASHHGRENGQHEGMMSLMQPDIVIISDGWKQYTTQETNSWYRSRARGIPDFSRGGFSDRVIRYVFTTRSDGTIRIFANEDGRYDLRYAGGRDRKTVLGALFANSLA